MNRDIICDEDEFLSVAKSSWNYVIFLISSIETYINILTDIQEEGLQDQLICAKISRIVELLQPQKQTLIIESNEINQIIKQYLEEISKADNFIFPEEMKYDFLKEINGLV